jgi:hypothetical protein
MLSLNSKHVQHVKIDLASNFKVNLITHLEGIALFSSNFKNVNTFHPGIYFKMAGKVDLGMLNMFAIKLNLYLL